MPDQTGVTPRLGKDLFDATIPFGQEIPIRSWWCVGSTLAILVAVLTVAAIAPWWPLRLAASIVGGLVLVRAFILYYDFVHGALLPQSPLAIIIAELRRHQVTLPNLPELAGDARRPRAGRPNGGRG